jgi:hypothetical protein
MVIDWKEIIFLLRIVRKYGRNRVRKELKNILAEKEKKTGRDYSFYLKQLDIIIQEL